ncbi:MAG: hypothetical protein KC519_17215, partial [Anaerolineae bacterium]|nr:hypothetical protein [Anaerolineae bacterium]
MTSKSFIQKYSVLLYFILTVVISWGVMWLMLGPGGLPIDPEQSEAILPFVYMAMLLGPSMAGVLMIGLVQGQGGLRALLARLFKWRVGARWYAVALLTAPLMVLAILLVLSLLS